MSAPVIAAKAPIGVDVEAGKTYWWCACGQSKTQPFCDGSHKGSEFTPVQFEATESKKAWFFACREVRPQARPKIRNKAHPSNRARPDHSPRSKRSTVKIDRGCVKTHALMASTDQTRPHQFSRPYSCIIHAASGSLGGRFQRKTIVENCSNTLILRCSASENGGTTRFASNLIGEREVIRPTISRTRRSGLFVEPHRSVSRGEQHITEAAVLPAEVEQLPDLSGYLKFASHPAWVTIRLNLN